MRKLLKVFGTLCTVAGAIGLSLVFIPCLGECETAHTSLVLVLIGLLGISMLIFVRRQSQVPASGVAAEIPPTRKMSYELEKHLLAAYLLAPAVATVVMVVTTGSMRDLNAILFLVALPWAIPCLIFYGIAKAIQQIRD